MRTIALMALLALPLFAGFFPQTVHTSVSKITNDSVSLVSSFPVDGMSGVVVHKYKNNLEAITGRIMQDDSGKAKLLSRGIIHHDELPTVKTAVKVGDKVIGGFLYKNVLILAPNSQIYTKLTSLYNKKWVHPDLYALYLSKRGDSVPTKRNLASFAKAYQVGLICIVGDSAVKLYDPISGRIVGQKSMTGLPSKGEAPFFMRFDKIESGIFSSRNMKNYYSIMDQF